MPETPKMPLNGDIVKRPIRVDNAEIFEGRNYGGSLMGERDRAGG